FGRGRDAWSRAGQYGTAVSIFRDAAWLAGSGPDRVRYSLERVVWKPAKDYGGADRPKPDPDGRGKQFGRCDGQNDRRAKYRGGQHRDQLVRARRQRFKIRVC